ncbi:MAG: LysR family transcriptional regulator [Coriobacteriales bacterium]|jgi:DNA-binding transcriptional LysR family regulator|nr:LysR family transcriptional regulator [Coriobacteriales bacterium]
MDIEVFWQYVITAKHLNFSEAARELNLAQPSLSRNIAALEQVLGQKLFMRRRPLCLTPAGKLALSKISELWSGYENLLLEVKALSKTLTGTVRVQNLSFLPSGLNIMASVSRALEEEYPNVNIELIDFSYSDLDKALDRGYLDVGFVYALKDKPPEFSPDVYLVEKVQSYDNEMFICIEKSNPLANRSSFTLTDFKNESFIRPVGAENEVLYAAFDEICQAYGFKPKYETIGSHSIHEYYMQSLKGRVSFFSKSMIEHLKIMPSLSSGLVFPELDDVRFILSLYMVHRKDISNPAALAFMEQLLNLSAPQGTPQTQDLGVSGGGVESNDGCQTV